MEVIMKTTFKCLQCDDSFERSQGRINRGETKFCSSSCSATYNNSNAKPGRKFGPDRITFTYCKMKDCGILISNSYYCETHRPLKIKEKTIGELENKNQRKANRFSSIRDNARVVAKKNGISNECLLCGYNKIVQVCHIKSLSSFPIDTKISEVNSLENLVCLCPNHHWEMDHSVLSESDMEKIKNRNKIK
jgi:hypothetical protein